MSAAASPQPHEDFSATLIDGQVDGDLLIGFAVDGRYRVERPIGEGGMGRVYEVTDLAFTRRAVLKTLLPTLSENRMLFERFLREARAAASVGSPHIVGVSDFGALGDGRCFYVMEHVAGVTLEETLDALDRPMDPVRALHITRGVARAVGDAHAAGVIHRDIKPDNVILCARGGRSDFVKLFDFGLALVASDEARLTVRGELVGTPHYMAPEQCNDTPVDERADLYAIGVLLYEMLTLELPFDAETFPRLLKEKLTKVPARPSSLQGCGHITVEVEDLVLRLIERDPARRFQRTGDLLRALESILGPESSGTYPIVQSTVSGEEPTLYASVDAIPPPPTAASLEPPAIPPAPSATSFEVAASPPPPEPAKKRGAPPAVLALLFLTLVLLVAVVSAAVGWTLAHPG